MGRPLRLKAPDITHHITSRTNGRALFLKFKRDQKMLCRILKRILLKYDIVIYSFTPMINHFHMLIHIGLQGDLSQAMCEFKAQYAKYYNKKYNTSGHFWGDRFRSTIVQDDSYALACLRYIDRNPMKAGLVDHPSKWHLGSFQSYAHGQNHPILPLRPHPAYLALSKVRVKRHAIYQVFVTDANQLSDELHGRMHRLLFFGSAEFIEEMKRKF